MKKQDKITMFFVAVIALIVVSLPLLGNTVFAVGGHDTFFHTQRIVSIKNALMSGQLPVRIYKETYDGYGYGASLFYPDLFFYIPALMHMLGLPLAASYNLFLIMINIATLLLAYYSFSKITSSAELGMIAALLYELCTYRMVDLYTRASIGELLALVFCPLVLCGLHDISKGRYTKWWILSIAFTGLLQSHVLTFVMMVLVAAGYILVCFPVFFNKKAISALGLATIVAICMNAWFLISFLQVSKLDVIAFLGTSYFEQTSVSVVQLFDALILSAGGIDSFGAAITNEMPLTPGIFLVFGIFLIIFVLMQYKERLSSHYKLVEGYLLAGIGAVWMTTNLFPWKLVKKIPILHSFFSKYQFAWRFNVVAILFLSVAVAYGIYYLFIYHTEDRRKSLFLMTMILCSCSLLYINQYIKQSTQYGNEAVLQECYMDRLYVVPGFGFKEREDITSNVPDIRYSNISRDNSTISFHYATATGAFQVEESTNAYQAYIEVPIIYYPGYTVLVNGQKAEQECSIWGIIRILIPEGTLEGDVEVYFKEPVIWRIMEIISMVSFLGMCIYIIYMNKKDIKVLTDSIILEENRIES